jgi:hypothetical protein
MVEHSVSRDDLNLRTNDIESEPMAKDAELKQSVDARLSREVAAIKQALEDRAKELESKESQRYAAIEQQLHSLTKNCASLEESCVNAKNEIHRLAALVAPLEQAFATFISHRSPYNGLSPPQHPQPGWSATWTPAFTSAKLPQVAAFPAPLPSSPSPFFQRLKQVVETTECGRKNTETLSEEKKEEVADLSEGTGASECLSPKRKPGNSPFSIMNMLDQREVPNNLQPQSAPEFRTQKPRTPQSRLTPQFSDAQRAPWSLLGSPGLSRSPGKSRTPGCYGGMQSPLPASSPFVILEDGGTSFGLSLRKAEGVSLGVDFIERNGMLIVKSVQPHGAVEAWNRQSAGGPTAGKAINPGDCVTNVNGFNDPQSIRRECQEKALLRLKITRTAGNDGSDDEQYPREIPRSQATVPPFETATFGKPFSLLDPPPGLDIAPPIGAVEALDGFSLDAP